MAAISNCSLDGPDQAGSFCRPCVLAAFFSGSGGDGLCVRQAGDFQNLPDVDEVAGQAVVNLEVIGRQVVLPAIITRASPRLTS